MRRLRHIPELDHRDRRNAVCPSRTRDWISTKPIAHSSGPERGRKRRQKVGGSSNQTFRVGETIISKLLSELSSNTGKLSLL